MDRAIPIGVSNFSKLITEGYYYVDKSDLIPHILKIKSEAYLFTRPRRFGKSVNLTMLDCFFNVKYKGNTWFDGLNVSECDMCNEHKNAYPVILINFKTLGKTYESFIGDLKGVIGELFRSHREDLKEKIDPIMVDIFDNHCKNSADEFELKRSLRFLSELLHNAYNEKVIILIDEYDDPIHSSYGSTDDSQKRILEFMRGMLSFSLKDNPYLKFAVVTGVTQIAKESIFSGLNNLHINNIFSTKLDEMFGFTDDEVRGICKDYGMPDKYKEAREWYDGYLFGGKGIYNPWSILMYVDSGFKSGRYWAGTSGNSIVKTMLEMSDDTIQPDLKALSEGREICRLIKPEITMEELGDTRNVFSVMVMSGYLKARIDEGDCYLSIPNKEMYEVFGNMVLEPIVGNYDQAAKFMRSMINGDAKAMGDALGNILMDSTGSLMFDSEHVYQGFILGIALRHGGGYSSTSEFESGNGRYDTILTSLNPGKPHIVIEFKKHDSDSAEEKAMASAREAVRQIHEKRYYHKLKGDTILYGVAFAGKKPYIEMERLFLK